MEFRFYHFRQLYLDMMNNGKSQEKFRFVINRVEFESIFLIDRNPFELLVGVRAHQFAFTLEIRKGFVTTLPDDVYYKICEILQLSYSEDHFSSFKFLSEIDRAIPLCCSPNRVQPHEVAYYKRNVPECEKIYFYGWNDHLKDKRDAQNFEKTRLLLGDKVADFCRENNISSMWTDRPSDAVTYYDPPNFC